MKVACLQEWATVPRNFCWRIAELWQQRDWVKSWRMPRCKEFLHMGHMMLPLLSEQWSCVMTLPFFWFYSILQFSLLIFEIIFIGQCRCYAELDQLSNMDADAFCFVCQRSKQDKANCLLECSQCLVQVCS